MLRRLHPIAGLTGFFVISTFWLSTVTAELFGSMSEVVFVKEVIPYGFLLLVPALAMTGASGFSMGRGSQDLRILRKKRRMQFIAMNGILILAPSALILAALAARGDFGAGFYVLQAIELIAGATNLVLMSLNIRDGLMLSGRLARPQRA